MNYYNTSSHKKFAYNLHINVEKIGIKKGKIETFNLLKPLLVLTSKRKGKKIKKYEMKYFFAVIQRVAGSSPAGGAKKGYDRSLLCFTSTFFFPLLRIFSIADIPKNQGED